MMSSANADHAAGDAVTRTFRGTKGILLALSLITTIWVVVGFGPIAAAWMGWIADSENAFEHAGAMGDSFGVVNALMSSIAVAFVILALFRQQEELEIARADYREMVRQYQEMVKQSEAAATAQKTMSIIEMIRIQVDSARTSIETNLQLAQRDKPLEEDPAAMQPHRRREEAEALSQELGGFARIAANAIVNAELAHAQFRSTSLISTCEAFDRLAEVCGDAAKRQTDAVVERIRSKYSCLASSARLMGVDARLSDDTLSLEQKDRLGFLRRACTEWSNALFDAEEMEGGKPPSPRSHDAVDQ